MSESTPPVLDSSTELEPAVRRELNAHWREAERLALSAGAVAAKLDVPTVFALVRYGAEFGLAPAHCLSRLYYFDGKVEPAYDVLIGIVQARGHELYVTDYSAERCSVEVIRRGSSRSQVLTFTIEDARRAGLTDLWVTRWVTPPGGDRKKPERYVVGDLERGVVDDLLAKAPTWALELVAAGRLESRDNWHKYPADMLVAKAVRRACKLFAPDALLGLPDELELEQILTAPTIGNEDQADELDRDDEVVDAELVDEDPS